MPRYRFNLEFEKSGLRKEDKDSLSMVFEKLFIFIKTDVIIKKYLKKYNPDFICPTGEYFIKCETDNYKTIRRIAQKTEQVFKEISIKDDDWINENVFVEQQPQCSKCNNFVKFSDVTCSNCGNSELIKKIYRLDELRVI